MYRDRIMLRHLSVKVASTKLTPVTVYLLLSVTKGEPDTKFLSFKCFGHSFSAFTAPTGVASNWFFTPYDNGSVVMTWDNPPNTEWNGEFSGYELSYGLASSGLINTTQPSQSRIVLKNIVPLTQYLFSLIFISTGGRGPNITFRAYPVPAGEPRLVFVRLVLINQRPGLSCDNLQCYGCTKIY